MQVHMYKVTPLDDAGNSYGASSVMVHTVLTGEVGAEACVSYVVSRGWARNAEAVYAGRTGGNEFMQVKKDGTMQVIVGYH